MPQGSRENFVRTFRTSSWERGVFLWYFWILGVAVFQRASTPPEFAQRRLGRSNGGHPQREDINLGVFLFLYIHNYMIGLTQVGGYTFVGVFDLHHFALLKRGCAKSGGFGAR